ncbi:hypothetical protein GRS96_06080 [Rathayibacter sp. VKM Ac-2803]|uniref:cyclophilin-like fold protein n=1 Tax=Rathayibacter sp. VKM Ac-2803 TaxID=2609256 RepID=UPI0013582E11|nr:cyclophilin-like fold protein [Rathayibacter sp. VKM Ac-2803]MWV48845.1 hypothetical protein [Rathayibacter sp. VKM Ac-2803]
MRADAVLVRGARLLLAPLGVLVLTVSGCSAPGDDTAEPATSASTAPAAPTPSDSGPPATAAQQSSAAPTALILRFGDLEIEATLDDSVAARSLLAQLPVTLDFRDYGGQEKIATLPAPLDLGTAPDRAAAPAGTLGYYAPDQGLVLYYDSVGAYPGIVPLGSFDAVEALQDASDGPVEVRVRD